jgi:hypothetical protein
MGTDDCVEIRLAQRRCVVCGRAYRVLRRLLYSDGVSNLRLAAVCWTKKCEPWTLNVAAYLSAVTMYYRRVRVYQRHASSGRRQLENRLIDYGYRETRRSCFPGYPP